MLQETLALLPQDESDCSDLASISPSCKSSGALTEEEQVNSESDDGEWERMEDDETPGLNRNEASHQENSLCTYTIVGDNVDKNIKPRDMRIDKQVDSLHAFHMYATKDRIDASRLPDEKPVGDLETTPISTFVPSVGDNIVLRENYVTLVSRVLVKHLKYFYPFADCVPEHIQHEHSAEMARKSEIVSITL